MCNCGNNTAVTKYRLHRPDRTYTDFDTLEEARAVNDKELAGIGSIRTARVVTQKA